MVSSQKARAATVLLERCLYYVDTPVKALKITNVTVFVKLRILFTYDRVYEIPRLRQSQPHNGRSLSI